jgi:hypothetical protein
MILDQIGLPASFLYFLFRQLAFGDHVHEAPFGSSKRAGRISGIVIGILITVAIISAIVVALILTSAGPGTTTTRYP